MKKLLLWSLTLVVVVACLSLKVRATSVTWGTLDRGSVTAAARSLLESNGYVVTSQNRFGVYDSVIAYNEICEVMIAPMAEEGHEKRLFETLAQKDASAFYVFQGQPRKNFPLIGSISTKYFDRLLRGFDVSRPLHPVFGVVASGGCRLPELFWMPIASVPWRQNNIQPDDQYGL